MRTTRLGRAAAIIALGLVAVACGGGTGSGGSGGSKGTISIGVDLPESGAAASSGLPTLNGVKFAVQKAGGSVSGWTLTVENRDDAVSRGWGSNQPGIRHALDKNRFDRRNVLRQPEVNPVRGASRRVVVQSAEPIDALARAVWRALPMRVRLRASVATWAFDNENRFDLVAMPKLAGVARDASDVILAPEDVDC